jgi:hypothetical protein
MFLRIKLLLLHYHYCYYTQDSLHGKTAYNITSVDVLVFLLKWSVGL